jgi:hypothetical protein
LKYPLLEKLYNALITGRRDLMSSKIPDVEPPGAFHQKRLHFESSKKSSPHNHDTQYCTDKSPYPRAGCDDSAATTAFAQISNQASYSSSQQSSENISTHNNYDFLLVLAVNSEIIFCTLSL